MGRLVNDVRTYFTSINQKEAIFFKQLFMEGEREFNYEFKHIQRLEAKKLAPDTEM